jgi:phage terminase large subunit
MEKESKEITIPYKFTPRDYQIPLISCIDRGYKRAVCIFHRRAGKDKTLINLITKEALKRVGVYYYLFPTYKQGRKIIWQGIDKAGMKFTDHIPEEIRKRTNDQEMMIELKNGSIIQIIGTDDIDRIIGTNPVGCVFSEYSLQNPKAWDLLRPILAENEGWAVFNYTPRGKNHGYELYEMAKNNPKWFAQILTVDDTKAISQEAIEEERLAGMDEDLIQQEFYCSFEAAIQGAYYAKQINKANEDGRITNVPYVENLPVYTVWDLGVGDSTAIWFVQLVNQEIRIIDYYEAQGEGLPYYAKVLDEKGYKYGGHYAPHDIQVREMGSGLSRLETARSLGINFQVVKNISIDDGINAARTIFNRCWFDKEKTKQGVNCLVNYHKEYDEKRKEYKNIPYHDWSSHGADAFRYLAVQFGNKGNTTNIFNQLQPKKSFI